MNLVPTKNSTPQLNPQQLEAVNTIEGPLLIIAGAGSGKTRVLTERIRHIIVDHNVPPDNILAVTFTNKAATEMKHRLPSEYTYPWIGTFHGICNKLLRIERDKPFVIFDAHDQLQLIKNICKRLEINVQFKPSSILGSISNAKNELLSPAEYENRIGSVYESTVAKVYAVYKKELIASNALDFDDLLSQTVELFNDKPEILAKYQDKFKYISVDEYQDTNQAQYIIARQLADKHHNICVVGDSDQNIYSWRGANIQNILNFEKDYPNTKVIYLKQNYRSTQIILHIANQVISANVNRRKKELWTENSEGDPGLIYTALDQNDEAAFIAEEVCRYENKNDVVVLYRTNAQSRAIEEVFLRRSIPYRIVGGIKFYLRKEIKDVMAYLRYIYNEEDQVSHDRIQKLPAYKKFAEAKKTIDKSLPPTELIEKILTITKYKGKLEAKATEEAVSRVENINELISVAKDYQDLNDFLVFTTLVSDLDNLDDQGDAVTLMTLHSVKGLEFPYVYICGCEEGLLPHYRSQMDPDMMEEERRLFYVGITRARQKIIMTLAKKRMIFGENWHNESSRFLKDIPESLVHRTDSLSNNEILQPKQILSPVAIYILGEKVHHKRFGTGTIHEVKGDDLIIKFSSGEKLLSSKYAPLEKVTS